MKTYRENNLSIGTSTGLTAMEKASIPARQGGFFAVGVGLVILAVVGGTGATMAKVQNERDDNAVAAVQLLGPSPVVASVASQGSDSE